MTRRTDLRMKSLLTIRSLLQTMITLASASLGFVSALAWNDAIKATFKKFLPEGESLPALYIYASAATILAITVVGVLSWVASKVGGEAMINREVDG
jgi:ABC-type branched-subunit amino acid transport system permease subunit